MGKRRLKAEMPRMLPDHPSALAKRLRALYEDIAARYQLSDGLTRRVAVLTALAGLEHQAMTADVVALAGRRRATPAILSRLRRRQAAYAGQFLAGLRTLEAMTRDGRSAAAQTDLAALLDPRRGT